MPFEAAGRARVERAWVRRRRMERCIFRWFSAVVWCDSCTSRRGDGCMEGCVAV